MHSLALYSIHVVQSNNKTKENLSRKKHEFFSNHTSLEDVYIKLSLTLRSKKTAEMGKMIAKYCNGLSVSSHKIFEFAFLPYIIYIIMLNCK